MRFIYLQNHRCISIKTFETTLIKTRGLQLRLKSQMHLNKFDQQTDLHWCCSSTIWQLEPWNQREHWKGSKRNRSDHWQRFYDNPQLWVAHRWWTTFKWNLLLISECSLDYYHQNPQCCRLPVPAQQLLIILKLWIHIEHSEQTLNIVLNHCSECHIPQVGLLG